MDKELVVLVHDEPLGTVVQAENGRLRFYYEESWQQRIDAFPLSLSMPLSQNEHPHQVVQSFISGLLPDNSDIRQGIARQYHLPSATPFRLVGAVGEDLAGAVQMVPRTNLRRLKRRLGTTLIREQQLVEYFESRKHLPGLVQITDDAGQFSLAGAQVKKAIYWVNDRWYEPRGRTPSTHIIKPPMPDVQDQVVNEHFCLTFASRLGLPACRSDVVHIGDKPCIVVERYDRQRRKGSRALPLTQDGGMVVRLHQEDMCQAMGIDPVNKYQDSGGPNMKRIMALLSGSGSPGTDRARFMQACMLNFIILGPDAHGKNFSILIEHGRYRLAPLYDIISILPYSDKVLGTRKLAMSVGGENKWRSIAIGHWQKAARESGYSSDAAVDQLREMLRKAPDIAQSVRKECESDGIRARAIARLASEIAKRCASISKSYGL